MPVGPLNDRVCPMTPGFICEMQVEAKGVTSVHARHIVGFHMVTGVPYVVGDQRVLEPEDYAKSVKGKLVGHTIKILAPSQVQVPIGGLSLPGIRN